MEKIFISIIFKIIVNIKGGRKQMMKGIRGITLITLVVTIVVLLILAGVSIAMLTGDNGILTRGE